MSWHQRRENQLESELRNTGPSVWFSVVACIGGAYVAGAILTWLFN